jgi:translation initiation factor 2B subunit (eIF-2B alpha/beta/delta family)
MALVHQLAARAFEVTTTAVVREDSAADVRRALGESCASERLDLAAQQREVAKTAATLLTEAESFVATLSASAMVRDALLLAHHRGRAPRVLASESRPLYEGRALATELAHAGIPVWLVVDAALPMLLAGARMVWLGADAVTDRGIVNKVGSFAVALAAREHSVPVYVLAGRRKFLPASTRALKIQELSADEVWDEAPKGVQPRNVCFELVPLELVSGIVVEDAVLGVTEARTVALDRAIPEELAKG